jgi:hypothetical protein
MVFGSEVSGKAREIIFVAAKAMDQQHGFTLATFKVRSSPTTGIDYLQLNAGPLAPECGENREHLAGKEKIDNRKRRDQRDSGIDYFFPHVTRSLRVAVRASALSTGARHARNRRPATCDLRVGQQ